MQICRGLNRNMLAVKRRPKQCSPDGENRKQRPQRHMQSPNAPQSKQIPPEHAPKADSDWSRNDVLEDRVLSKPNPCCEVDKKIKTDNQQRSFTNKGQPKIRFFVPVEPEQRQCHDQRHDQDQYLQKGASEIVADIIPIEAELIRDRRGIAQL